VGSEIKKQDLTIREIREGEEATVREVFYAALDAVNANLKDKHEAPDADLFDISRQYSETPGNIFLVGLIDDHIMATGALTRLTNQQVKLRRMAIPPDYQGRGYGRQMLEMLENFARRFSYNEIILDTADILTAAIGLYTNAGFAETHREGPENGIQLIYFHKQLDATD
jgi:GNAT superfamily N-acetyltransferase